MHEKSLTEIEQQLLEMKSSMEKVLSSSKTAGETVELDQSRVGRVSRMDAMQQQAMANAENSRFEQNYKLVLKALNKIKSGDYGFCESCDELIHIERLKIKPETPLCIDCQGKHEKSR